jgi:hypothetical protein
VGLHVSLPADEIRLARTTSPSGDGTASRSTGGHRDGRYSFGTERTAGVVLAEWRACARW